MLRIRFILIWVRIQNESANPFREISVSDPDPHPFREINVLDPDPLQETWINTDNLDDTIYHQDILYHESCLLLLLLF